MPSPDLVGGPDVQDLVLHDRRVGQHQGTFMETLISLRRTGSVKPIQRRMSAKYGLRGVRVGEAKNPGPRRRLRRVSNEVVHHDLPLVDSSDDDTSFVLPGTRCKTKNSNAESDDEGNVARRDFSFPVPSVMPGSEAVRMEDSVVCHLIVSIN